MAPNLIGNSFMIAESTISQDLQKRNAVQCPAAVSTSSTTIQQSQPPAKITKQSLEIQPAKKNDEYKIEIVWRNIIAFIIIHILAFYGCYITVAENLWFEYCWGHVVGALSAFGTTAGAHRLWAHKSYKAKLPLRIILMLFQTLAFQNCIHEWVRDHRVHHKFTDTHADPHNSRRGFFFSHMGWLLCKKHPDVKAKGKQIDMSDLDADPVCVFQKKYYFHIMPFCSFVIPALIPYFYFGCSMKACFFICSVMRYVISLHCTWLVNSAAHMWGMRPYDKSISPTNSKTVSFMAYGEGWHNYHHVFPWDYKAAELAYSFNATTAFINLFAKIGWAYDLKTVPNDMIRKRIIRTGDGSGYGSAVAKEMKREELMQALSTECNHDDAEVQIWGWDDKDLAEEDKNEACIINKEEGKK